MLTRNPTNQKWGQVAKYMCTENQQCCLWTAMPAFSVNQFIGRLITKEQGLSKNEFI